MSDLKNILKTLTNRSEFLTHLSKDIEQNDKILDETIGEIENLKSLKENLETLGKYPEHTALIPLGKNIYFKGRVKHTGEYNVIKEAVPNSYVVLQTLNQTLESLDIQVKAKEKDKEKVEYAKFQLRERIKILNGNIDLNADLSDNEELSDLKPETADLPQEIKSDKGVARKVGDYYEILEFEED